MRSARKHDVPLRMPRRNTSPSPASLRISSASARMRSAICSAVNTGVISFTVALRPHFVKPAARGTRHLESFRDLDAGDPDDFVVPEQEGNAVPNVRCDFTINQKILQLFWAGHAQGVEAVAF